jgi:NSS family neurotransmitter:Na+ symporter
MFVVAQGVKNGLEKAVSYLMPSLLVLLIIVITYSMTTGHFMEGIAFMFTPGEITRQGVLVAMGHAFFTLSLGMGAIMVYGSYLPENTSITQASFLIVLADTGVALLAGLAIFPIVFANGLEPGQGAGLIFKTLPIAFGHMEAGTLIGTAFFTLLVFAAWTSAISLIEPAVAWLVENRGLSRLRASLWLGLITWFVGLGSIFSFNIWGGNTWSVSFLSDSDGTPKHFNFMDTIDFITSNLMLPIGGLFIAIFAAWLMRETSSREELKTNEIVYQVWRFLLRFVAPIAVIIVFLYALNIIK